MNQRVISLSIGRIIPMACAIKHFITMYLILNIIIEPEIVTFAPLKSLRLTRLVKILYRYSRDCTKKLEVCGVYPVLYGLDSDVCPIVTYSSDVNYAIFLKKILLKITVRKWHNDLRQLQEAIEV